MIKEIAAFGCSFTQGEGVDHYRSWPYCLGYNFNTTVRNYGMGGCSNKYIATEFIRNFDAENFKDKFVAIAWTSHIRSSFWDDKTQAWDHVLVQYFTQKRKKDIEYYYNNIYTEFSGYFESLIIKNAVQKILETHKVPYVFVNALVDDPFNTENNYILKNLKQELKSKRYLDFNSSLQQWTQEDSGRFICHDGCHPSVEGHIHIAERMTKYINELNLLEA